MQFEIISRIIKIFYVNSLFLYKCECIRGFQKVVVSSGVENEIVSVWVKNETNKSFLPKYQYFSVFQPNSVSTKCEDVDECLRNRTIFKKFAGI